MGGASVSAKYVIHARMEVQGLVDKPDIIGAIFGQTEGLLGGELDLRELQKTGRLGRIEVTVEKSSGKTISLMKIPSNLDKVETALIAAAIETIDKVGPYQAKVSIIRLEDVRAEKRKRIIERARALLKKWEEELPESKEIAEEVLKSLRITEIRKYGPEGVPAGPDVDRADTVIVVEGRADVINLLKHGYKNVIAMEGAVVPKTIVELSKRKNIVLFVDGDRGGELIVKNAIRVMDIDYVARAPPGREVEELTGKEIAKALRSKLPAEEFLESLEKERKSLREAHFREEARIERAPEQPKAVSVELPEDLRDEVAQLRGTLEALLYDKGWNMLKKIPVKDLAAELERIDGARYVVFDGIITQRIVDIAYKRGIEILIGARLGDAARIPEKLKILTFNDIG